MTPTPDISSAEKALFAQMRARFPGAMNRSHLDVASRSLMPASSHEVAAAHIAERIAGVIDKDRYFQLVEHARASFARLIGAGNSEIAITKNVSEGLNIVAASIDWKAGDEVFLCADIEHPNNIYTWRNLERLGVKVRDFAAPDGLFPLEAVIEALEKGSRAKVVTVSGTSFKPGFRTDLNTLGRACRRHGVSLVVDAAQSAGITHLDVEAMHIDALAASTQKGLCSLYGMGFLYVRESLAQTLKPRHLARFGVKIDATHEADYDTGPVQYRAGALRFDLGNYNFLAASLVGETLELLHACGTQAIDRHVTALTQALSNGLIEWGCPVVRPEGALTANMVCLTVAGKADEAHALQQYLQSQDVQAAVRRNLLRFSMHFYNDMSDIDKAIQVSRDWFERR